MTNIEHECAAMAATMLDVELAAITIKIDDEDELTPLQQAVVNEWRKRQTPDADAT